jgi:hypothetical protein
MAYIYLHRRNDTGEVFYVGKGMNRRAWSKKRRNPHWHNVVNKSGFTAEIIVRRLTEEEAYWAEPLLIEAHGLENLTNIQVGGFGFTSEQSSAMREENWKDPEYRKKISEARKGQMSRQWQDPEYREKMCKVAKEHNKRMWQDPAVREKHSKALKRKVKCDKCGRMIGICVLPQHQRGSRCYNSVT